MPRKPSRTKRQSPVGDPLGILHKNVPTDMAGPLQDVPQASPSEPTANAVRQQMIAEAAYYRAEQRGFEAGHELEDWLAAEAEIVAHLKRDDIAMQ